MCFHICIYICNPEGARSEKMTRCVFHFHRLVFFLCLFVLNKCCTLRGHTWKKSRGQIRKQNKEHVLCEKREV